MLDERIIRAEEVLKLAKENINERYRLGYHIMAPANWINDPNGLIQYKGEYHVFYQHHPYDENWGPMHWGHVKSKDCIHWKHCPIALAPGDEFDKGGCFSGSAVDNNGELTLIYTGHNYIDKEKDTFYETQNIAVSKDGITFEKYENNPVIAVPPEDSIHHFRDPKVWKHEDKWYMVVGNSTKDKIGRVILYSSLDLRKWDYVGTLATSKGELGYMWECPDFFKLGNKYVLSFSPQGIEKKDGKYPNLFQTGYIVGDYDYDKNEFKHGTFNEFDNGHDFYAVQTFLDDKGRRIAIGWMDMWESDMPTKQDGWCGALTMPRELTLSNDNKIKMNPIEEAELLREENILSKENMSISGNNSFKFATDEKMLEINVIFDASQTDSEEFGIKIKGSSEEELVLKYDTVISKLTMDCSKYGKDKDSTRKVDLAKNSKVSLRVFLDRSSIEVFINYGEAVMTSRIYPKENIENIEFFTKNSEVEIQSLKAWKLKEAWI
ncbi:MULTISPECIES: glycoside hydrolase family 32 protein [Clostridium]|uniref:Sucrose-6-phosphate hydrolase n=1 Tax=Clostridium butyricum TaxID=1492 RepID=A0A512TN88_CLOBU|nr:MULTISPECIES: glycoside hydrolase family 32 protein [Clostridium]ENZ32183.1 sucrose-6-phosphate hydrolase [Clostridium butyricum 60E.3]MDB2155485.1 glycoside hydrolase family 32 protein [Clostridium butyricum]MDU1337771.1 glycoside hydrolase family 32 protein [Clostridium butyricum]MDU3581562.1 glycoside hydrolase family 32 protein [Clostridium butyricum]MDU3594921.1 glycoside hydrolase family 32 protein [Clostridium butyricum]